MGKPPCLSSKGRRFPVGSSDVWILGAGGHAKVVLATLQAAGLNPRGFFDDKPGLAGTTLQGLPVLGPFDLLDYKIPGLLAHGIGHNAVRARLVERFSSAEWATAVHPWSSVHPSVSLGVGTILFAGTVVQPDTKIGPHCILNTSCSVDHDSLVDAFSHLAPGTRLAGGVRVSEGVFLGIGACVVPGIAIGAWSTIGAGAVVVADIPAHVTAVGVPARPI